MTEPAALRPIAEAADAIRRLDAYETSEELRQAVLAVVDAMDRALRIRLRDDPTAPEHDRLTALSRDTLPIADVVRSLRTRDLISIQAAGTVHEAMAAGARARESSHRTADADVVHTAVERLRAELNAEEAGGMAPDPAPELASGTASAAPVPERAGTDAPSGHHARVGGGRWIRGVAVAIAATALLGIAWMFVRGGTGDMDSAVAAFRAGRLDSAAAGFERAVESRPGDVTARLFLARSYRRLERPAEAAMVLREAVELDPEDPDVRRELGHLFMELDRPATAVAQYERALEYDPESSLNWTALIRALRQMEDPRAEQLLRDAPAEVQAALSGA